MPIEIRELAINLKVGDGSGGGKAALPTSDQVQDGSCEKSSDWQQMVMECTHQVLEILEERKER